MKSFLKAILLFTLVWFVLASVIDYYYTVKIRHSQVREYKIWEDIFNSRITADIIVLGSSRAMAHYNPEVFDSILHSDFYNLGLNGKLIDMDFFRYHQYKKYNNHQPTIIIWDVMSGTFGYSGGYGNEQFMAYIHNRDIWHTIHRRGINITLFDRYIPLLRYWRRNMLRTFPNAVMQVYKGYRKECHDFDSSELNNIPDSSINCSRCPALEEEMRLTIQEMQHDGATVVLVYSPFYYRGQKKYSDLQSMRQLFGKIAVEENCLYLDYLDDPINNDSSLFKNASHLNCFGADVFSAKLSYALDSIINASE